MKKTKKNKQREKVLAAHAEEFKELLKEKGLEIKTK